MNRRTRSNLIASAALLSLLAGTTPASAQFGGVVFDPSNYAQNVLTAARSLQQINNQITSLQNQAQSLINQARNLASLPTNALSGIQQSIDRTRQLIAQAQQVAYNVQDIDRVFAARYPSGSLSGTSSAQLVTNAETRWHDAVGSFQDSLRTQATIVTNLDDTRTQVGRLVGASQTATGALQAAQAGNQLVARQLADLTALVAAQSRAASLDAARATADEAQGREQTRRFLTPGSGYIAQSVSCACGLWEMKSATPACSGPTSKPGKTPKARLPARLCAVAAARTICDRLCRGSFGRTAE